MTQLAPNLFERRYGDLLQMGLAKLPSLAPAWTDYNAHDPGITLMELLAFVAEAQLYSLARSRRDERDAYAALMGVMPEGAVPARGTIWPDDTIRASQVVERDAAVHPDNSDTPAFYCSQRMLWVPARIASLTARLASGRVLNHTGANQRGGPAFEPFGPDAGAGDVLRLELAASGKSALLPADRAKDARLILGVRAASGIAGADCASRAVLAVEGVIGTTRYDLPVVEDTTCGFLQSGTIALDLSAIDEAADAMTLTFRAPRGFPRAPKLDKLLPNVLPVTQSLAVVEIHKAVAVPDFAFDLETPGLSFEPGSDPLKLEIAEGIEFVAWKKVPKLSECGPDDRVYVLDPVAAHVTFGNGVNGRIPPQDADIRVAYAASNGAAGNMARNRKWAVHGMTGLFGVNPDAMTGGRDPSAWLQQRRDARLKLDEAHALISDADIEDAALALGLLEVGRAAVVKPPTGQVATGTVRLIAMRKRGDGEQALETPAWLAAVGQALGPRMPLGARLAVVAPRYVGFTVRAQVQADKGRDPIAVEAAIRSALAERLALVGASARPFGLSVSARDLAAWIQAADGVARVTGLQLVPADGTQASDLAVPRDGLPSIDLANSRLDVQRGGAR
ncbi:MAG TPA: putative baseplate assembly protein [Rhizomicrobium sp.]|nr:putative baseplate assembly protein [Rhizomicrobium sp.]